MADFLMHYGVLGMKWGVRKDRRREKDRRRLSRFKGKEATYEEADKYRSDINRIKKEGFDISFVKDTHTGSIKVTDYMFRGETTGLGKQYGQHIIKQAQHENYISTVVGSTAASLGFAVIAAMLGRRR